MSSSEHPIVLCFSGLDPTGGAGIQADIESILSLGGHCAPIITALTVQNSQQLLDYQATDEILLIEQARAVLEDMPVDSIKLGMLGSIANIEAIHSILVDYPDIPVVLDPVLQAGGGGEMSDLEMIDAMTELLFPETNIITPNSEEAFALTHEADSLDACAEELQELGCAHVLITGSHEDTPEVINTLYGNHRILERWNWKRLPNNYHGSGCTLAAAIAAMLAQGADELEAVTEAQSYTQQALEAAFKPGKGQHFPNRIFWSDDDSSEF